MSNIIKKKGNLTIIYYNLVSSKIINILISIFILDIIFHIFMANFGSSTNFLITYGHVLDNPLFTIFLVLIPIAIVVIFVIRSKIIIDKNERTLIYKNEYNSEIEMKLEEIKLIKIKKVNLEGGTYFKLEIITKYNSHIQTFGIISKPHEILMAIQRENINCELISELKENKNSNFSIF